MRSISIAVLPVLLTSCILAGCTSAYTVHLRDSQTQKPIPDAQVTVAPVPRIYSFLDIRHYLGDLCDRGKSVMADGKTDSRGQMRCNLPSDLDIWRVSLGESWVATISHEWMPMLTQAEFDSGVMKQDLVNTPGRPEARFHKE